jgi:hypothetical protein
VTEYAIRVGHGGFVDRFLRDISPPGDIGMSIWWATVDGEILRFKSREEAERLKRDYESHFAVKGASGYSFTVMKTVMVAKWTPIA